MSIFSKLGALIFAPTDAAGNPRQVINHDAQVWSTEVERIIQVALEGGDLMVYGSLSALNADLDHPAHTGAILIGESIADDGLYMKQGASGSGSWVKIGNVPGQGFVRATNAGAGTPNTIAATTPVAVNETQLILLPITDANTASPVTVAFNGGAALTVKTVSGNDVAPGGLPAGSVMLGVVQGGDFRLLSDQTSAVIQAAAEAAADRAEAAAASVIEAATNFKSVAVLLSDATLSYVAGSGLVEVGAGDIVTAQGFRYEVANSGSSDDHVTTAGGVKLYSAELVQNVLMFEDADPTGASASDAAFSTAARAASARVTTIPAYDAMPQAPTAQVIIPAGVWHLSADIDTGNKAVTWLVDEAAKFTSGTTSKLKGRIKRQTRENNGYPFGLLDHATGYSIRTGDGSYDGSPFVTGHTNPNTISTNETVDLVGLYADVTNTAILHQTEATYDASGADLITPIDAGLLRVGMVVQTGHTPFYRGQITSWASDGTRIEVQGWYQDGSTTAGTPANDGSDLYFNPFHKVWAHNANFFLVPSGYGFQGAAAEYGVWNDKITPTAAEDAAGRTWGTDVVNLGPRKGSTAFIARGSFFEGFRATGEDVGFHASDFPSLGFASPTVGFKYTGGGRSLEHINASGQTEFQLLGNAIEIGTQGASNSPLIDFHSGAALVDYDSRIIATGGTGTNEGGALTLRAGAVETTNLRPVADNAYTCGSGTHRFELYYGVTGTINTSDPRLKKFLDAFQMGALKRAAKRVAIQPYKWLDAIASKGEDAARTHIGVSAQDVLDAFAAEGLDARSYALFCEDDEYETVEVETEIEVPETEEVEKVLDEPVVDDGRLVLKRVTKKVQQPKTVEMPMVHEDGSPVMREVALRGPDGNPVFEGDRPRLTKEPAFATVPVMRKKKVIQTESRPTGRKRMGLRYDQLMLLMIAALAE